MRELIAYRQLDCLCTVTVNVALISHARGKYDVNYANKIQNFPGVLTITVLKTAEAIKLKVSGNDEGDSKCLEACQSPSHALFSCVLSKKIRSKF